MKPEPGVSQLANGVQSHAAASASPAHSRPGGQATEVVLEDEAGAATAPDGLESKPAGSPHANGQPTANGGPAPADQTALPGSSAGACRLTSAPTERPVWPRQPCTPHHGLGRFANTALWRAVQGDISGVAQTFCQLMFDLVQGTCKWLPRAVR